MDSLKTFFYSLTRSLFEPKYYNDIAKAKFGFSFRYLWFFLFLIIFIKSIFIGGEYLKNRPSIQPTINTIVKYAENFYPKGLELKIRDGQLSTNVEEPYVFDLKERGWTGDKHLLIIDTKGSIDNYPDYNTFVLATKQAVVYPSKSNSSGIDQTSVFYFRDLKKDFTFNKNIYDGFLNMVRPYTFRALYFIDSLVLIFLFLFIVFGSLIATGSYMFFLLFLNFFVWLINLLFRRQYDYWALYRMGMHAVTWPILIVEVLKLTKVHFPNIFITTYFIFMIVVLSVNKANKSK